MADVKVLSPLGTMYAVPEDQVQLAIERGYTVASQAELQRRALAKETQGEDVLAHASAAIDGALLNIPEAALSLTDWGKDKIKKWDQAFPEREATRLAGAVVPVIATLGLATPEVAAASGVRATAAAAKTAEQAYRFGKVGQIATAIPRMAATAGEAVAASSGLTGAARAGLSLGVAGGLENAIQETAAKTRELSVNDRLNGEGIAELFGATAKAGGVGLLFGGALGAGAEKLRASWAAKAADALEQVPEGTDPTWWGKFKASGYKKAFLARGATVEEAEQMANKVAADDAAFDIQNRMDELVRGKRMPVDRASDLEPSELDKIIAAHEKAAAEAERKADSELVGLAEEVARKAAASEEPAEAALRDLAKRPFNVGRQSVRDNVNELINDELVFRTVVANAARKESILLTEIPKTGLAGQEAAAEAVRLQARQLFDELSAGAAKDVGQYAPGPVRDFGNYIKGLERSLEAARQAPEEVRGVKFFTALDQFKRDVGRRIGRIAISDNAGIDTRNKISAFYSVPQRVLEDANFWGAAGTEQASRNVILSFIADRFGTFVGDITEAGTRRRNPVDPFGKGLPLASSKKIEQLFYEMAASPGDAKERTAREVIDALKRSTKRIVETGDFSEYPELLEVGKRNLARIDAIEKGLDSGAQMAREAIIKNTAPDGVLLDVAQAVSRTPGAPNVGGLFQSLSDPNTLRRGFRIVESLGVAREKRIGASVARAMRAMDDKAAPIANTAVDVPGAARATTAAGETVQLGEDLAAPLGGGATRGRVGASPLTRRIVPFAYQAYQAYTRNADRVRQLAANPQEVRSRLENDTKNIQGAPGAREAAIDTAMKRLQYLNDTLPKEVVPGTFFSSRIPPTKQEVNKWMNRWKATERPLSILDDLADGTLKPEMVEAVEAVYPETMGEIRSQIMAQLADMDSRNRRPPYADRIALGLMFGVQTVPEMDPDFLRLSQQIYAQQAPEQRQGGVAPQRAPNFAANYQSGADETATST